jgi:hypothetical protein
MMYVAQPRTKMRQIAATITAAKASSSDTAEARDLLHDGEIGHNLLVVV